MNVKELREKLASYKDEDDAIKSIAEVLKDSVDLEKYKKELTKEAMKLLASDKLSGIKDFFTKKK